MLGFFVYRLSSSTDDSPRLTYLATNQIPPVQSIALGFSAFQTLISQPRLMPSASTFLLVDIGNSALKAVLYDPETSKFLSKPQRHAWQVSSKKKAAISELAAKVGTIPFLLQLERKPTKVLTSSVNDGHFAAVQSLLNEIFDAKILLVDRHFVPMTVAVDLPDMLGIDRLLAGFAAWKLFGAHAPLVVIQVGTAITIDLISKNGVFEGGVILPSESTLYASLAEKTDRLPLLKIDERDFEIDFGKPGETIPLPQSNKLEETSPGKNTSSALRIGVQSCIRGGVARVYSRYCKQAGTELKIIATGGGAATLANAFDGQITLVSNLVLKGLSLLESTHD